ARKRARQRRRAKSLIGSMREFLTPEVFKQVRNSSQRRKSPRWDLHPLLYILLLTTYCCGDSLPEKFEAARAFYVTCCPKRRRPGHGFAGLEKATAKLPMPVLRSLAAAIRQRAETVFSGRWKVGGFIPFGCDGTRQACPRTEELERRMGTSGKEGSPPMIWNTSIVHLTLGFPFCWRLGKGGKASERTHLIQMLPGLPALAMIVTDAGYVGYDVVATILSSKLFFLIRMSSNATFYTEDNAPLTEFREGIVYYWPKGQQARGKPAIRGRLLRIHSRRHKADVWLFTNVLDSKQLSLETAGVFYRWRWENEGFFRTYKRTLKKVTLMSRTVRLVHREAEVSMIATQLLLCQGALAMPIPKKDGLPVMCSPRGVLLEVRREIAGQSKSSQPFTERIARAQRERRLRTTPKQKREWPHRKAHTPPHPPMLLRLTKSQKAHIQNELCAA
ncbi:MAG: transposase, partial [Pirellulales bacterium]|nr:transposase [Pirellulales bacterium]